MNRHCWLLLLCTVPWLLAGCTSFVVPRSAEVVPGPAGAASASFAAPVGEAAAWFWSFDCGAECGAIVPGYGLEYTHGFAAEDGGWPAFELGAGVTGILYPYVHGYVQLHEGERPYGVGARVGLPFLSLGDWDEYQLYGRYDIPIGGDRWLLLNPALFLHTGNSPNENNPGTFLAFVPAVGLQNPGEHVSFTPSASLVLGWTDREQYVSVPPPPLQPGPVQRELVDEISGFTAFATIAVSVTFSAERR